MKFGLEENIIEKIIRVLEHQPKVDKAYIFGSRAKGNYRPDSDIDIAIKGYDVTVEDILKMSGAIDKLGIGYEVDFVDYNDIKEDALKEHIDRVGMEFYSRWKEHALGDVINLKRGYDLPKQDRHEGSIPIYSSAGITDYNSRSAKEGPGVITGRYGTIGEVFYSDKPYWPLNTTLYVQDFKESSPKFIYYLLKELDFEKYSDKSAVPGVNRNEIHKERILIPPYADQIQIAQVLTGIDNKIDLLHRENKTLESMAETIFRHWFVEEAKEDWEEKSLDECIWFDPREKIDRNILRQFFEMKCLSNTDMNIAQSELRVVTSGSIFRNGDTLLARITPCLENGKTGFVMQLTDDEVAMGSTEFIVMRSRGFVSPYWIYCLARSEDFRDNAILSMTGTSGRQRVQLDLLKSIRVRLDRSAMGDFHQKATPIFSKIKSNQSQIYSLGDLRDTLLPKLLSGEARVKMP